MAHSEAGPAARLPRSAGGIVTIIAGAAGTTLVALDMATSGDPHAAEWLGLLVSVFLGLGLLAAPPAVLAASQVPVVDGPVLLLALDGPLLAGAVRGPDPVHPRKQNHRGGAESVRRAHPLLTEFKSGTARPGQSRQCARRDRGGRSLRPLADSDAARPGAGKPPIVLVIVEALQRTRPPSMRERLYVDAR